ncbi:UDP-N-acetylglucosamine 2-epimerase [Aeromicrobium sp.]|uniref:UDP-N-acetylglucosamine 2-epimerase n=1 Tax=Aeromicrobium sp. TaxID=1871063 RepID=UPI001999926C|nr:UDP-N-acetylglucosamine 2-epimerase [Aeromicrobium sp.]MBC7630145.1 UDP-N-acetylglucosamine 2-epimerase (hydrolyzing) [Aeromicrobium sp.]
MTDINVAVFVGTRADLGPLEPVITALADHPDVRVTLLTGVAFDVDELRAALQESDRARVDIVAVAPPVDLDSSTDMLVHAAAMSQGLAVALADHVFALAVVLGDRWELLTVVPALFLAGVPIVHLHGGEVTDGALDDRVRHAVTKLADIHCVATERSADRVRQMGEPADRVHVTGAPGLDRYHEIEPASDAELTALLGREVVRPLVLFTYHPPTVGDVADVGRNCADAVRACTSFGGVVVATHPGFDAGRDEVISALEAQAAVDSEFIVIPSLGHVYPRVLRAADVVVGNSSSGIIEAASAHLPAVDIGIRQQGREHGENVLHSDEGFDNVRRTVGEALEPSFRARAAAVVNPYGDGRSSERIVEAVLTAVSLGRMKPFVEESVRRP